MSVTIGHRPDRGRCPKGVKVGSSAIFFHDATSHLLAQLSTPFCPLTDSPRGDIIIESKRSLLTKTISMQTNYKCNNKQVPVGTTMRPGSGGGGVVMAEVVVVEEEAVWYDMMVGTHTGLWDGLFLDFL